MRLYYILFLILVTIVCCSPKSNTGYQVAQHYIKTDDISTANLLHNENGWEFNFKNLVCINMFKNLYGPDFYTYCLKKDASQDNIIEWLNSDSSTINKARKIAEKYLNDPSLKGTIEGNKVIYSFVMSVRLGHDLDSITGQYYKEFQRDSIKAVKE